MDIAVVGAGVALTLDEKGICTHARVALGAVAPTPVLVADGAWLLPSFVARLSLPDTTVRSVHLHHADVAGVAHALSPRLEGRPLLDRHRLGNRRIWQAGEWLCEQARAHDLPVVESLPFDDLSDRARRAMH